MTALNDGEQGGLNFLMDPRLDYEGMTILHTKQVDT